MKRMIAVLCSAAMIFSLAACSDSIEGSDSLVGAESSESVDNAADETDYSNQTLTGQVTSIEGTKVILQLGELSAQEMQGEPGQPGEGDGVQTQGEGDTLPEGEAQGDDQTPPDMPEGEAQGDDQAPPDMPEGGAQGDGQNPPDNGNGDAPADMPNGNMAIPDNMGMDKFTAGDETAEVDIEGAVIQIESGMESTEGSLEDIVAGVILVLEIGDNNAVKSVMVKYVDTMGASGFGDLNGGAPGGFGGSGEVTQGTSANTIDSDGVYSNMSYSSTGDDENALRVDGAAVTLSGITVEKSSGSSSNAENGDFYGMNAALLATNGANVTITDSVINSSTQNGNGIFSYGEGTVVTVSDCTITTTADNSGGIQTTGGGTTNASNLTIRTSGSSAAAIRSDRGGGTVNVDGGSYTSNGYNSPAVYSTADITVKDASLIANNSEALVIEGKNSIVLEDCDVSGNMSDTQGTSSDENVHNVMIYQSMSGDADVGTSVFTMTGGILTSNNGDMIYVTNTHCILTLSGVEIIDRDGEGYLLNVTGNSASRGWGTAGANGGQVEFTAENQILEGNIIVDTISTLSMTLTGGSSFTGTINIVENAQGGSAVSDNVVVTIDSGSTWNLTGDCTLTSLENNGTINFNGYTITLADGTVLE